MSVADVFQYTGALAGLISLLWLIGTQIWGTYDARTIRRVLDQQAESYRRLTDRIDRLEPR